MGDRGEGARGGGVGHVGREAVLGGRARRVRKRPGPHGELEAVGRSDRRRLCANRDALVGLDGEVEQCPARHHRVAIDEQDERRVREQHLGADDAERIG